MGEVWEAERVDGHFEQRVALKLLKRGVDSDEVLRRFLQERQILARFLEEVHQLLGLDQRRAKRESVVLVQHRDEGCPRWRHRWHL